MSRNKAPETPFFGPLRRLWADWLRPHRRLLYASILFSLVTALATGAYSKFIQFVMSALERADASVAWWGPLGVIALTTTNGLSQYFSETLSNRAVFRMERDMRSAMFGQLVDTDLARLQSEAPASLAARFFSDITLAGKTVRSAQSGLTGIATLLVTLGFMLTIDWSLTLVMILIFGLALVPINIIGRRMRKLSKSTQAEIANMSSEINEDLAGIRVARTYQLEEPLRRSADGIFERLFRLWVKQNQWQARVTPVLEILMGLAIAVLLLVVGYRISEGTISVADFTGILTGVGILAGPARKLGGTFAAIMQGRPALDRVFEVLDVENTVVDGTQTMEKAEGAIAFEDVTFAYPDGHVALSGVSLDIPPGTKTAFVGRSGAGKSTIFNLLPRLYDVTGGVIRIDGQDIRDLTLADLRRQIAVVSQDSVLFTGTVADNIRFGRRDATQEEIEAAARDAAAHRFIEALPGGYETRINPAENSFSGGEKQRLSIARAILRNAPILMLDEATSALDAESEALIQEALDRLSEGKTTLVIAHRLSTIRGADRIVVMENGAVVEQGSHADLMEQAGLYAELHGLQFAGS